MNYGEKCDIWSLIFKLFHFFPTKILIKIFFFNKKGLLVSFSFISSQNRNLLMERTLRIYLKILSMTKLFLMVNLFKNIKTNYIFICFKKKKLKEKKWENLSITFIDFMKKILKKDQFKRFSAKKALKH